MLRDCFRCGNGWHEPTGTGGSCICICSGMTDVQAQYLKDMRDHMTELRRIGRKAFLSDSVLELTKAEREKLGLYT